MKKLLLVFISILTLSCSSNDNDDNSCDDLTSNGEEISLNLISAALNYVGNPTNITCLAYENTAVDYIDYSNSILNCLDAEDRAELEQEIEELETELAGLDCTQ